MSSDALVQIIYLQGVYLTDITTGNGPERLMKFLSDNSFEEISNSEMLPIRVFSSKSFKDRTKLSQVVFGTENLIREIRHFQSPQEFKEISS